jgi:ligand-binding sensor domain-containing protein
MTRLKQYLLIAGCVLLVPGTAKSVQGTEAGAPMPPIGRWQVYTNDSVIYDLVAMDGGRTCAATWGGVVCYGTGEQVKFTTADGLADNAVRAIAVDGAGRLWFGTDGGGVSVLDDGGAPFDKSDDAWATFTTADGLASSDVQAIAVDGAGRLWFGTDGGGVSVLDDGGTPFDEADDAWATFTTADGLAGNDIWAIAVDGAGRLWFGAYGGGASVLDHGGTPCDKGDDAWATFTTADSLADNDVIAIAVDGAGRLWFGTYGGGASVLDHGGTPFDEGDDAWATFTTADGLASSDVFAIAVDGTGRLWFGTYGGGASVLDHGGTPFDKGDDTWATFTTADGLADNGVFAIAVDGAGRLWFGTYGGGVSVLDHGGTPFDKGDDAWATFTTADGLADNHVAAIAVDGAGRLWFGTYGGGVSVLDDGGTPFDETDDAWATFTTADGLAYNDIDAIAVDGAGRLWFGTDGGGVSVLDDGGTPFDKGDDAWATFTTADGLAGNNVWAIAVDGAGRLWFGTYGGGVSVLDDGGTPFDKGDDTWATFTTADGLAGNNVEAIAVDGAGRLWFGMWGSGVSVLDDGGTPFDKGDDAWATFTTADGLASSDVFVIAVDGAGRLWFGTPGGGASVLDDGGTPFDKTDDAWACFNEANGLANDYIFAIAVDDQSRLWFGMWGGVSVLDHSGTPFDKGDDGWATFTTADGLADNNVQVIAVDAESQVWFGTYGGGVAQLSFPVEQRSFRVYLPASYHIWGQYYEDNDHWGDAHGPLINGKAYEAYPDDDDDYYYFMLSDQSTVNFSVENFAPTSTYGDLLLYGPVTGDERGDLVRYYGKPDGSSSMYLEESLGPGKYYVRVYTAAEHHSTTQLYHLTVFWYDSHYEPNQDWESAYGPLTCGQAYQAHPDDKDDYYYFRLAEESTVSVSVEDFAPTSTCGDLLLYGPVTGDERGDLVAQYGESGSSSMSLGPPPLEPGKYYVRVYTAEHHSTTQLYRLTVHCAAASLTWP